MLAQVPVFTKHYEQSKYTIYVHLEDNQMTRIPANVFQNLSTINASRIYIYLSNNQIVNIEPYAFKGIGNSVRQIDLQNNNLTHLPMALKELTGLNALNLLGNPIVSLDNSVLANIGKTLYSISMSIDKCSSFPTQLSLLTKLSTLRINNIRVHYPLNDSTLLHGFENSLRTLEMSSADFERIPAAVCELKYIRSFISNNSPNLSKHNASIFDQCTQPMTSVTLLKLQNDQLTIFPKIETVFPNLQVLQLNYNNLYFIESSTFKGMASLTTLQIGYNRFTSVPSAINKATNLRTFRAYYNQIHTVEDFDFVRLHNLTTISLAGNPLVYLSPDAFTPTPFLQTVRLDNTMIGHIPRALLGLKHLDTVWLSGKPTICACNAMSYLKPWNVSAITIYATCSSGKPVKTFLKTDLPKCS